MAVYDRISVLLLYRHGVCILLARPIGLYSSPEADWSTALGRQQQQLLLPIGALSDSLAGELPARSASSGGAEQAHRARTLLDFALLGLLMGSDYLPKPSALG